MKVYVVMGNDFPEAVFANENDAETYCQAKKKEAKTDNNFNPTIYWRYYTFEVQ